jgi:hypothetical protein
MTEPLRRGVVEIETLRRYGRSGHVPVGTRAVLPVSLYKCPNPDHLPALPRLVLPVSSFKGDATEYSAHFPLIIGDDCSGGDWNVIIPWGGDEEETIRMVWTFGGVSKPFEGALAEFALMRVVETLEYAKTQNGHQRFRVIRAEWAHG